jgi:O-antigen ligase/polysaccharide polymerase Wzy-like membrane protein
MGVGMLSRYWLMADNSLPFGGGAFAALETPLQASSATPEARTTPTRVGRRERFGGFTAQQMLVSLFSAAAIFWIGYDGGSYSLTSRTSLAIAVSWAAILGVAVGLLPAGRSARAVLVPGFLLAAFALFTLASSIWAVSAEDAFFEFDRAALYLAIFVFAALVATRMTVAHIADGLGLGIAALGILALASRLFPGLVSQADVQALLPAAFSRLSYPVNYWNGLGILLALAYPLLLRAAVQWRGWLLRGGVLALLPALSAAMYLTSSRAAFIALGVAVVIFAGLAPERWAIVEAVAISAVASVVAIVILDAHQAVVNPPLTGSAPSGPGRTAAILIGIVCLGCGGAYALRVRFAPPLRGALAGRVVVGAIVVGAVVATLVAHPIRHFEAFKAPPVQPSPAETDFVQSHLFSANGSGRWQFWSAAADQFRDEPLHGAGAGSYEAWWAQHGSLAVFVRDAHSLYLETLGELGVFGLVLLAGALLSALALGVAGVARARPLERTTRAALLATAIAFLLTAAMDWMWELTVVSVVGLTCLGLLAGLGLGGGEAAESLRGRRRLALAVPFAAIGLALIVAQAIALVAETRLDSSQSAVRRGDTAAALAAARSARDVEPWAASPFLQLALINEQAGSLPEAERRIRQAIHRNEADWRLWLTAARIQTKRGEVAAARQSLARARELNPRSAIFRRR